ncbi:MAG: M20/M25/M40 family metallo-hydrolase [Thermoanaerobaculia bacterium]
MNAVATGVLEQILAATVERLSEFCAISSESGNSAGLRLMAARFSADLEGCGLRVEIADELDSNGTPQPVLYARGPSAGASHLLLLGHLDTVLPAVEPVVEGRRLFATGALDMKGGLAMFVGALELLEARGQKPPADLLFVAVPDEESESFISGAMVKRWSANARTVLVLEPGKARGKGETLVAGRRGLSEWSLEVTGQAAHSGLAYWSGRSALAAAADWSARAQAISRTGPGPTVNVSRLVAGTADFVQDLGKHFDMLGTSRQLNVVSDRALAEGEIRFLSSDDGPKVLDGLARLAESVAAQHEVTATFRIGMTVAPVDPAGPGAPLVHRTVELAKARGFHLEIEEDRGGISFPNFLADPRKTPVVDGLGPTGEGMHIRGEYLDLDSLEHRVVLLADLLATL